jgi:hypothetical protein
MARLVRERTFLAVPGERAINNAGICCPYRLVTYSEPFGYAGTESLHEHVGLFYHPKKDRASIFVFEVQGYMALVSAHHRGTSYDRFVTEVRGFHNNDISAVVGKQGRTKRTGEQSAKIDDL